MKHPSFRRVPRLRSLLAIGVVAAAVLPAVASADIPIVSFKAGPVPAFNNPSGYPVDLLGGADQSKYDLTCTQLNPAAPILSTQAGATSDYCINFKVDPGDAITGEDINNTLVGLPVGTQASIDPATKCTDDQFGRDAVTQNTCPGASQVGTALATLQVPDATAGKNPAVDRRVQNAPGRIYALSTPDGKAAKFGVELLASTPSPAAPTTPLTESKFVITVSQLGDPKVGLQNQTDQLSKLAGGAPIAIQATSLRFWGAAAAHPHVLSPFTAPTTLSAMASDFFFVGTTCQTDQTATLQVNPYTDTATNAASKPTTATTTYKLTGCNGFPFTPTFTAGISGDTAPGGHPQLNVSITNPAGNDDLGAVTVVLPIGISTDLKNAQNPCPLDTFNAGGCTDATVIGSVGATLSGIGADQVSGVIHKVSIPGQVLPAIGLQFKGRLPLRVVGLTTIDSSGRVTNTFSGLPSLPERTLNITLNGGPAGILQLPPAGTRCVQSGYDATLAGQNGQSKGFSVRTKCSEQLIARLDNATSRKPRLAISGSVATGKKIQTIRLNLPSGLAIARNKVQTGIRIDHFEVGVTGTVKRSRLSPSLVRFTVPKPGSNGLQILTRTGTLVASPAFAKSTAPITVDARLVYTDGTKATQKIVLRRKP